MRIKSMPGHHTAYATQIKLIRTHQIHTSQVSKVFHICDVFVGNEQMRKESFSMFLCAYSDSGLLNL